MPLLQPILDVTAMGVSQFNIAAVAHLPNCRQSAAKELERWHNTTSGNDAGCVGTAVL